ncbi:hypothetical protein N7457_002464 [Penicillium paradoxum]|uniref:uncharacterized protein n=1 Tax=Penicillium paradoxum TaxID=176176 RepID=UPI002546A75C|nr:uncharacterized protein N7457_002464 [Penicillium paradoxum]KAJ5787474.1 hypothetical protein N7457_002464 [Penicillium paradoxum]
MITIQSKVGEFSTIFAPQSDNTQMILDIFDALTTIFGFGVSGIFNIVEKDIAKVASNIVSSRRGSISSISSGRSGSSVSSGSSGSSVGSSNSGSSYHTADDNPTWWKGKEVDRTTNFQTRELGFDAHGYAYDMSYQLLAITAGWTRDNAPKVHDKLEAQNSLSSALGDLFTGWKDLEVSYLKSVFSGDASSQSDLQTLIENGKMNFMPNHLDQDAMAKELESVLYGQLMPTAWKTASDGVGAHPFILKTDISCDNRAARIPEFYDYGIMSDVDSAKTRVCWREKLVFLVNANEWNFFSQVHFTPLPGADSITLSGDKWGNITLEDIVSSAITGYEGRGNSQNGYKSPGMDDIVNDPEAGKYGKRVRYPGFFNIPVCESLGQAKAAIVANHHANSPYWPCADPPNFNEKGTKIHVNKGYITINEDKVVCDSYKIPDPGYGETLSATFYGRFDGSNTADTTVQAKCKVTATWPKSFGDIYYGEDNCVYDSESKPINDKDGNHACCNESDDLTEKVSNPYMVGAQCQH